jgi:hypothetical protein
MCSAAFTTLRGRSSDNKPTWGRSLIYKLMFDEGLAAVA